MKINQSIVRIVILTLLLTTGATPALADSLSGTITKNATTTPGATTTPNNTSVEKSVRNFFKYNPVMAEIARCESEFRQYTDNGKPLRSGGMIGVFQFYESIHTPLATTLGFDLTTLDGNLSYAKHIYETEGTSPWNGSRYCWENATYQSAATTVTVTDPATRAKLIEQIHALTKLITLLQKQLTTQKLAAKERL